MKTRNSHGLLQLGRDALAYCQCASALISGNKALLVSVDLIGEKNQVILELAIWTNVCEKFGLCGDEFQLRRVSDNKIIPKCIHHFFQPRLHLRLNINIRTKDEFIIQRMTKIKKPKSYDKCLQTEPVIEVDKNTGSKRIRVRIEGGIKFTVDGGFDHSDCGVRREAEHYIRLQDSLLDLAVATTAPSGLNAYANSYNVKFIMPDGKSYLASSSLTCEEIGLNDWSRVRTDVWLLGGARDRIPSFISKSISAQTMAKPGVVYMPLQPPPQVQPPPPVNDPPPAKTWNYTNRQEGKKLIYIWMFIACGPERRRMGGKEGMFSLRSNIIQKLVHRNKRKNTMNLDFLVFDMYIGIEKDFY